MDYFEDENIFVGKFRKKTIITWVALTRSEKNN